MSNDKLNVESFLDDHKWKISVLLVLLLVGVVFIVFPSEGQEPESIPEPDHCNINEFSVEQIEGNGTEDNPYQIETTCGFQSIESGEHYVLTSDIDFSKVNWSYEAQIFTGGSLDGQDHTVYNITVENNSGVFPRSNSDINNINFNKLNVSGNNEVGGVVGTYNGQNTSMNDVNVINSNITGEGEEIGGIVGINNSTITNSTVDNTTVTSSEFYIGGVIGNNTGLVKNVSSVDSEVIGKSEDATGIGGIIGRNTGNVTQSYSINTTVTGHSSVGGLVGNNYHFEYATISESYANNEVTARSGYGAGLVGRNTGVINNSYALGVVNGDRSAGLVGVNGGQISNSYASVEADAGLVYQNGFRGTGYRSVAQNQYITNSYWDSTKTDTLLIDTLEDDRGKYTVTTKNNSSLTTEKMKGQSATNNMEKLNFKSIWTTSSNETPYFQWENS